MKRTTTILFALFITCGLFAQKVKIKNEIATVDGEDFIAIKKDGFTELGSSFAITDFGSDDVLFTMSFYDYNDPDERNQADPKGRVVYAELFFPESDQRVEISTPGKKYAIKQIYRANLIEGGKLNQDKVDKFVSRHGVRHSVRQDQIAGGNGNVIIINNTESQPAERTRNRVNINLGL